MIGEIHRHAVCQQQALKGIFWPMRAALVERLRVAAGRARRAPRSTSPVAADLLSGMIFSGVLRSAKPPGTRDYTASAYREGCVEILAERDGGPPQGPRGGAATT